MLYSVRTKLAKEILTCTSAIQGHIKSYGDTAEPIFKPEEDMRKLAVTSLHAR